VTSLLLAGGAARAEEADEQAPAAMPASAGAVEQQMAAMGATGKPNAGEATEKKSGPEEEPLKKPRLLINGFAMLDVIGDFNRVNPDWLGAFRPSKFLIPDPRNNGELSFHAKQTRLNFEGFAPTGVGEVHARFEFDLYGTGDDAGQTTMRVRHAYGELGRFLAGQTNSVFMDVDVFPNVIDYWGPNGMMYLRTPQARYTPIRKGGTSVAVALEGANSAIDPGNVQELDPSLGLNGWTRFPDFAAHYRQDGDWGHFQIAGIVRVLGFESTTSPDGEPSGEEIGGGLSLSAVKKVFKRDKIYAQFNYGRGISSYFNDGGVDLAPATLKGGGAETVPSLGYELYYEHAWGPKWTSSIGYSEHIQDNTDGQLGNAYHKGQYFSVNLLYSPVPHLLMGGEFLWGKLKTNDGSTGDDSRLQFSAKYNFSN